MSPTVKLLISHHVISRKDSRDIPGTYELKPEETVGSFISRLASSNRDRWKSIWDQEENSFMHYIIPLVNDISIDRTKIFEIVLHDGDKLTLNRLLSGG